jgi:hypothetical protein
MIQHQLLFELCASGEITLDASPTYIYLYWKQPDTHEEYLVMGYNLPVMIEQLHSEVMSERSENA